MLILEASCLAIVLLYVVARARQDDHPAHFLRRLTLLVVAAWIGENTVIHAYGFYQYSSGWSLFVDRVPLMILLIWPVVIHSAWDLARWFRGDGWRAALMGGALVLADASLIEPIAVSAQLWSWNEPGLFGVPPVGILGWAYFAALCILVFQATGARRSPSGGTAPPGRSAWLEALVLIVPALGTHAALLATWWGGLRWVNVAVRPWPVVVIAWCLSIGLALAAWRSAGARRVPLPEMLLRVPAALFFFVLLALYGRHLPALVVYALAFAPPYLVVTAVSRRSTARRAPA